MKRAAFALLVACASNHRVELVSQNGDVLHTYDDVTYATTPDERQQGLIGRGALGDDQAMVLEYPVVDQACITNAQVDFSITAIFVGASGAIVAVESLEAEDSRIPCHDAVLDVIETNSAGAAAASGATTAVITGEAAR